MTNITIYRILIIVALETLTPNVDTIPKIGNPTNSSDAESTGAAPTTAPAAAPQQSFGGFQQQQQYQQPQQQYQQPPQQNQQNQQYQQQQQSNVNMPPRTVGGADSSVAVFPIKSLSPYQNRWTIRARAINKSDIKHWSNARGEGKLFSVTFVDESGEIRASAFNDGVDLFYNLIQENGVYYISGGQVKVVRNRQYSNVQNEYEMTLDSRASVTPCSDAVNVPGVRYEFVELDKLYETEKDAIVDVIGIVKEVQDVSTIVSKTTHKEITKREITIVDHTQYAVRVTLWGKQAESFGTDESFGTNPVVAFKGVKVGDFGGRSLSVYSNSTLSLNPDLPECYKLRGWFDSQGATESNWLSYNNGAGNTMGGGNNNNSGKRDVFKFLSEVSDATVGNGDKPDYFAIRGTILHVKSENFAYPACPGENCNKKVIQDSDGWRCERCQRTYANPEYRYVFTMAISDATGQNWVQVFNDIGQQILGCSADEMVQKKDNDEAAFNAVLSETLYKMYNFKLKAKSEMYNDRSMLRLTAVSANPLKMDEEANRVADMLQVYC